MKHRPRMLSATFVRNINLPGRYGDGRGGLGLSLLVKPASRGGFSKSWSQSVRLAGKPTSIGLGRYPVVTLAMARDRALDNARAIAEGRDPRRRSAHTAPTFAEACETVIAIHAGNWKPGGRDRGELARDASRLRAAPARRDPRRRDRRRRRHGRAAAHLVRQARHRAQRAPAHRRGDEVGRRPGPPRRQPRGRGALGRAAQQRRPPPSPARPAACPGGRCASAGARIGRPRRDRAGAGVPGAHRGGSGEVRNARREEFDREGAVWTVPAERMKAGREHRVPLSPRALEVLDEAAERLPGAATVFPTCTGRTQPHPYMARLLHELEIDAVPHGFRSSFRDWAAECTDAPREVCELALAHVNSDRVEAAYRRSDLFEKRRALMNDWAAYVA